MSNIKVIFGLLLAVAAVGAFAVASTASDRSGTLEVEKECSEYTGAEGSFCTFTASNLKGAPAGSKVIYLQPAESDSDVILDPPGPGNSKAFGRCELPDGLNGVCTFTGGTGEFTHFSATLTVTHLGDFVNWNWEGPYSFSPQD